MEDNEIESEWFSLNARWDGTGYTDRSVSKMPGRILKMMIIDGSDKSRGKILQFIGGPTGHETYYINDLFKDTNLEKSGNLCICAGTINSWPSCYVKWDDVLNYLRKENCI